MCFIAPFCHVLGSTCLREDDGKPSGLSVYVHFLGSHPCTIFSTPWRGQGRRGMIGGGEMGGRGHCWGAGEDNEGMGQAAQSQESS